LTSSIPGSLTVPATVGIPAGSTNAAFNLTVVDNLLLDGPRLVKYFSHRQQHSSRPGRHHRERQ